MASRDADLGFTVLDSRKGDLAEFEPLRDPGRRCRQGPGRPDGLGHARDEL
jgi:hypothetical protein